MCGGFVGTKREVGLGQSLGIQSAVSGADKFTFGLLPTIARLALLEPESVPIQELVLAGIGLAVPKTEP